MMKINPQNNIRFDAEPVDTKPEANSGGSFSKIAASSLGAAAVVGGAVICCRLSSKPFAEAIAKKGMELRNNLLVHKESGEKFTGEIKRYIGKLGFNKVETRRFKDGVIVEKTCKNCFGKELEGEFYKDGKLFAQTKISNSLSGKKYTINKFYEDGSLYLAGDGVCSKDVSVFEQFVNNIKNSDWPAKI